MTNRCSKSLHDKELRINFEPSLLPFYSVLKTADPYLRLVFITGVTKFAQMSIFSTLNQLMILVLRKPTKLFGGMTRTEIEQNFAPELEAMALKNNTSCEAIVEADGGDVRWLSLL